MEFFTFLFKVYTIHEPFLPNVQCLILTSMDNIINGQGVEMETQCFVQFQVVLSQPIQKCQCISNKDTVE